MTSASYGAPRPASNYRRARRVNDACDALQISRSHLYTLAAAAGKIKLIRIGGRTLVPEAEIDRLAEEGA
jgi:excisionase family DNA binding protein